MRADVFDRLTDRGAPRKNTVRVGGNVELGERGDLYVSTDDGTRVVLCLKRGRVLSISANGILLEGFEERGGNRYVRRELWCAIPATAKEE